MINATVAESTAVDQLTLDAGDSLGRLAHLLRYRERCNASITRHCTSGNHTAQAQWVKLLRSAESEITELLPEVHELLNEIESEIEK